MNVVGYTKKMSWLIFLALSRAGSCNDNTVHWLQPKLQGVDLGMLQQKNAEKAWCYPTAAASLLGKLANDGKWISGMDEENKYPTNNVYNIEKVWGDYAFHENNTANLAFYTETNKLQDGTGTTLEKGREGIMDFISAVDPTKRAEVVIHPGYPDNNTAYPLLLHIKPSCILFDLDDDNATKLADDINATGVQIVERLNGNPANLDHTVVAYAISTPVDQAYRFKYDVAMNLVTDANPSGKQCNPTRLLLVNGEEHCIRNYTTINITEISVVSTPEPITEISVVSTPTPELITEISVVSTPTPEPEESNNSDDDDGDEELSTGALVGIIVGGVVLLLGLAWWFLRRRQLKSLNSKIADATSTTRVGKLFF